MRISTQPRHAGRITRMLTGNFIELLDDHVPGLWAEMLNDRCFEGVRPTAWWVYHTGEPNICDRAWDPGDTWSVDTDRPLVGSRCARFTRLCQSGLATRRGVSYHFTGWLRGQTGARARLELRVRLPRGDWDVLAAAEVGPVDPEWRRYEAHLISEGTTTDAVFELTAVGGGELWADKLSLMPDDNVDGWRADVVRAVREVGPGVMRWGGLIVDPGGYKWKDCIGSRDTRVPFPNGPWGRIDSNDVGIDEFCRFCEAVGAPAVICVSFADGAQSAADLVQYCNASVDTPWGGRRAENGHPRPYAVRYWQIGNEVEATPAYLAAAEGFCRAIKGADPRAVILSYRPTQELLDRVGRHLGYVCPHHYDIGDLDACAAEIDAISRMLRGTAGCEHTRIGITEWNVTGGDWGYGRGRLATLGAALRNARYLNLLLRRSDVVGMSCRSNLCNSHCTGLLLTRPGGLLKPPAYHVMKLYSDHLRPAAHDVDGSPAGVDAVACVSERRDAACILAVNTTDKPVVVEMDPDWGPAGGSEAVCDTLDRRQPDIMNHWSAPDRVGVMPLTIGADQVVLPALSVSAVELERR